MRSIFLILTMVFFSFSTMAQPSISSGIMCNVARISGGDAWPWSIAKPFPWDNIQGYWKLGDDDHSYLVAKILSTTDSRKILSLSVLDHGVCSRPYAKGTGYVDVTEKNVVRALVNDGVFKYQVKLGMFDSRDLIGQNSCSANIMALSIQVIARVQKSFDPVMGPLDPTITEMRNMVLKKVTINVNEACKR